MSADVALNQPVEIPAPMSYQQTLSYSQGLRKLLAEKQLERGVPSDKEGVELLLKTLKDMDHTALTDRKNSIDQEGVDSSKGVADAMVELVKQQVNQNPFMRKPDGSVDTATPAAVIPQVDPEKLGHFETVEGETDIGIIAETSDEFLARMHKRAEA